VLAARGLSDLHIAEQLFISVRTVHAHLHAAYVKLDVPGRGALAAVLGAEPPASGETAPGLSR
jgi:DNA-binding NarL/FixJ family response regulator